MSGLLREFALVHPPRRRSHLVGLRLQHDPDAAGAGQGALADVQNQYQRRPISFPIGGDRAGFAAQEKNCSPPSSRRAPRRRRLPRRLAAHRSA